MDQPEEVFLRQSKKSNWVLLIGLLVSIVFADIVDVSLNEYVQLMMVYCCINIILATSLNLVNGFTGQFSLGHAGFMAVGAYTSAWLSMRVSLFDGALQILNFPLYAILGGLLAAAAGFLVGLPSLRLKGDYLAIVTLGFGEIIRVALLNLDSVGGARGLYGVPSVQPLRVDLGEYWLVMSQFFLNFSLTVGWTFLTVLVLWRLINSSHGRTFMSVRDDEIAAESMGINTTQVKVRAFVISSFFAGVAGSLFAHTANYLNPSSFMFMKSVDVVIMVVLGGMGSFSGSVLAAIFVTLLPELLRPLQEYTGVDLRMIVYSLSLVLLMILRPKGLFGSAEVNDIWRKYVRKSA
jgi:branched-chain amino acid transport system permease protein